MNADAGPFYKLRDMMKWAFCTVAESPRLPVMTKK